MAPVVYRWKSQTFYALTAPHHFNLQPHCRAALSQTHPALSYLLVRDLLLLPRTPLPRFSSVSRLGAVPARPRAPFVYQSVLHGWLTCFISLYICSSRLLLLEPGAEYYFIIMYIAIKGWCDMERAYSTYILNETMDDLNVFVSRKEGLILFLSLSINSISITARLSHFLRLYDFRAFCLKSSLFFFFFL